MSSSFVFYPREFRIHNYKGRPASGRHTNVLELKSRIKPVLSGYDVLIYIDEIVSGGMMAGYLRDMFALEIHNGVTIIAAGLAGLKGLLSPFRIGNGDGFARVSIRHAPS